MAAGTQKKRKERRSIKPKRPWNDRAVLNKAFSLSPTFGNLVFGGHALPAPSTQLIQCVSADHGCPCYLIYMIPPTEFRRVALG